MREVWKFFDGLHSGGPNENFRAPGLPEPVDLVKFRAYSGLVRRLCVVRDISQKDFFEQVGRLNGEDNPIKHNNQS